jgi:pimeloyl-ACP methyl ester carboxylesterase
MLPGSGDKAADFIKNGFIKEIEASGFRADAVAVDAHLGYYVKRNLLPRLLDDVVLPAKKMGYKNIWLLGISMGGLGAVIYAKHYPHTINGLILLAPFLGYPAVLDEISTAGGLTQWSPKEPIDKDDYEHEIWKWLKGYTRPNVKLPYLVIGYGNDDWFKAASSLLGESLPNDQVYVLPGEHDWDTWCKIFHLILKSYHFAFIH